MMKVNPKIFRAYDVRGVYPIEINEKVAYNLATAFVSCLKKTGARIALGRDLRKSSVPLAESFIKALVDSGCNVIDLGVITTPMLYFAVGSLKLDGGVMITASHNPLEYNGVKFVKKESMSVGGEEIKKFYSDDFSIDTNKKGKLEKKDISAAYLKEVFEGFKPKKKIKIKIEDGGGAAGLFLPELLKKLGVERVLTGYDLAIAFDFDADRLYVFDEKGEEIRRDIIGGIIVDDVAQKEDKIVIDIISTKFLKDYFEAKGVDVICAPVGHYFIKKIMRENDAVFALELSGHYYFKSFFYSDSAFFALRKILEVMDKNPDKKISELAKVFEKYFHSGEINLPLESTDEWQKVVRKIRDNYKDGKQNFEDGISVEYDNFWFNLRPSNTEPVMRLTVEAKSRELLEEKKNELLSFLV